MCFLCAMCSLCIWGLGFHCCLVSVCDTPHPLAAGFIFSSHKITYEHRMENVMVLALTYRCLLLRWEEMNGCVEEKVLSGHGSTIGSAVASQLEGVLGSIPTRDTVGAGGVFPPRCPYPRRGWSFLCGVCMFSSCPLG